MFGCCYGNLYMPPLTGRVTVVSKDGVRASKGFLNDYFELKADTRQVHFQGADVFSSYSRSDCRTGRSLQ